MPGPESAQPWMGRLPAVPGCRCHACRPDTTYDDLDRRAIQSVLRHGWHVVMVSDEGCDHSDHRDDVTDHGSSMPGFAYTIGLMHRMGHPELLMSGLDVGLMHRALNSVAERVLAGRRLAPGDALEDVLAGVPVAVEQVADEALQETVTWSGWFHRRRPEALALVWPDRAGVFAWQPGAPPILDEVQPREWRVPLDHRGGLAVDPVWLFPVAPDERAFSCTHVVDRGDAVLWAARQSGGSRREDWSIHCGAADHTVDEMRLVHLAHLVRSAPSLREISGLGLDQEAFRPDVDSPWTTAPIPTD